jgi:RNA-directed DNA polymerase
MSNSECKERNCFSLKEFCYRNGIGRTTAYKESPHGPWRLAVSPALHIAMPTSFFRSLGLRSLANPATA